MSTGYFMVNISDIDSRISVDVRMFYYYLLEQKKNLKMSKKFIEGVDFYYIIKELSNCYNNDPNSQISSLDYNKLPKPFTESPGNMFLTEKNLNIIQELFKMYPDKSFPKLKYEFSLEEIGFMYNRLLNFYRSQHVPQHTAVFTENDYCVLFIKAMKRIIINNNPIDAHTWKKVISHPSSSSNTWSNTTFEVLRKVIPHNKI